MNKALTICLLLLSQVIYGQKSIMSDTVLVRRLQENIDSTYNFNFNSSDKIIKEIMQEYPKHPFPDIYKSMVLYWKYFPITPGSGYENQFLQNITNGLDKVELQLKENPENAEAIFFNLMGRLLIMQYYADNNNSSKVIPYLSDAYKMLTKGFKLSKSFNDFNFSSGVYNYYREYYPKAHPVYKPIAYFFPKGDAKKGIQQLELNGLNGIFLKTESISFLVYINTYFEHNHKRALKYIKQIKRDYPNNLLYNTYQIQNLLLLKKYSKAKELIIDIEEAKHYNDFFIATSTIYKAVILEKKDKNFLEAKRLYLGSIEKLEKYGDFANQYKSYAYFGLSRILSQSNPKQSAKYKKTALNLSVFPEISFN